MGGLMSYAAKSADVLRETTLYVDKILKGSKPANLPVTQPNKFEMVITGHSESACCLCATQRRKISVVSR